MPCDYHLLPHQGIQSLAPYIPGKSADELAHEQGLTDIIKLASNENPLGCSPLALQAVQGLSAKQIATYPISAIAPLRQKIAHTLGVDKDMVTLSNGSDTLFSLLMTCFALHVDKHILVHDYGFIIYNIEAHTLGIEVISTPLASNWQVDIEALLTACNSKTALIFLANPNNPTGQLINHASIERILQTIPQTTLLVLDQAYHEYIDEDNAPDILALLKRYSNLVITRTFSKAYGLAGLRVGYAIAHPQITDILHRALTSFTVNQAALAAAEAALDDKSFIQQSLECNQQGLIQVKQRLAALSIDHLPTFGNFITIDCKRDAGSLYQGLLGRGIIVRPLHPYGLTNYLRVTIGTMQQNKRFLDNLEELLHHDQ